MSFADGIAGILPGLGPRGVQLLARYASESRIRQGRALYCQGDEAGAAFLLMEGRLKTFRYRSRDSFVPLDDESPGDWPGLAEVRLGVSYLCDAVAAEPCVLARVPAFNLAQLLKDDDLKSYFLDELARRFCRIHSRLDAESAGERVAAALSARAAAQASALAAASVARGNAPDAAEGTVRVTATQVELAEAAGVTRETANRVLARLERAGVLETGRGEILVYDLDGLRDFSE